MMMETIEILTIAFPETLGTCVVWQPPGYFNTVYRLMSPFVDPRTLQKVVIVSGDAVPGGEVDRKMNEDRIPVDSLAIISVCCRGKS